MKQRLCPDCLLPLGECVCDGPDHFINQPLAQKLESFGIVYLFHFTEDEWRLITNYYGQYMTDSAPFRFNAPLIPATGP